MPPLLAHSEPPPEAAVPKTLSVEAHAVDSHADAVGADAAVAARPQRAAARDGRAEDVERVEAHTVDGHADAVSAEAAAARPQRAAA